MESRNSNRHMLHVLHGSITNYEETFLIDNIGLIVDFDIGAIFRYGDIETSDIIKAYETRYSMMADMGFDVRFITFDRYEGILSIEEICTIVNYGLNSHARQFLDLFEMDEQTLRERLIQLSNYGY